MARVSQHQQRPQVLLYDQSSQRCTKLPGIQSFHSVLGVLTRTSSPHRPLPVHSSPGASPTHASHLAGAVVSEDHPTRACKKLTFIVVNFRNTVTTL